MAATQHLEQLEQQYKQLLTERSYQISQVFKITDRVECKNFENSASIPSADFEVKNN